MKEFLINILQFVGLAWWVEIRTDQPQCTYYFGPFLSQKDASRAKVGYIEDLEAEGAQGLQARVGRYKPSELTIFDEPTEFPKSPPKPAFSGQM
ncbi:MAG: DUF1816 domain-containing protein [Ectothiorhodospiraceae bacterium]|nr:DUF1816 domain-containing protein [Ectothiorhodospiraceae bacterium]